MNIKNKILDNTNYIINIVKNYWIIIVLIGLFFGNMFAISWSADKASKKMKGCKDSCIPSQFEIISESCWCYGEDSNSLNKVIND